MVIRTEYRGQRYSMGSSDPLPAEFEVRFGSLNFQATGNGYLMRIINRDELHPWRSIGPGPVPTTPDANAPTPVQEDVAGPSRPRRRRRSASVLDMRGWNDVGPRASPRNTTRPLARWRPLPRGSARFPSRSPPSACATPRWRTPHPPAPMWRCAGAALAATSRRPGTEGPIRRPERGE
jgi:hypothetical protein